jgi:hypothetical protein
MTEFHKIVNMGIDSGSDNEIIISSDSQSTEDFETLDEQDDNRSNSDLAGATWKSRFLDLLWSPWFWLKGVCV